MNTRTHLQVALIASSALVSGCASTTGMLNREIQENEIAVGMKSRPVAASVLGMSENRRGILIRDNERLSNGTPRLFFCAEPPPDVAMSTRAGLAASLQVSGKGDGNLSDSYTRIAMLLANRTSLLDIYRTAVFSLCQLHMNGSIDHKQAESMFREITLKVIDKVPATETPRTLTAEQPSFGEFPSTGSKDSQSKSDAAKKP